MVTLAAGHYTMGSPAVEEGRFDSEGPQHEVVIAPFAVGKHEVTPEQFSRFVAESGYSASAECRWWSGDSWKIDSAHNWQHPGFAQTPDGPVVCVTWNDASAYARWLADKTGKGYRLLTEAEWEYAARGGATTARPWGGYAAAPADGSAWLSGNCEKRVIRGASWWSDPRRVRAAMRFAFGVDVNRTKVGFRVARTL